MLTDAALKHLKPKDKPYKVSDRDGMYVLVSTGGTISFRLDYRLNGRRETVTFGKYGPAGLSLARAREKCMDAKRMVADGLSPSIEKQREKRRIKEAKSFGQFGEKWLNMAPMADSTRRERALFEKLKEAYVKARYSKHYRVTAEEIAWFAERIEELGRAVHAICSERLAWLGEQAARS